MSNTSADVFEFDGFRLDVVRKTLLFEERLVAVHPKVVEVLAVLVQKAGDVVTKNELLTEVWNGTFIAESGIHRNISILRQVLSETAQKPLNYIETIPRRGYRFIGSVRALASLANLASSFTYTEKTTPSIAVLPFKVVSSVEGYEHFGMELADALTIGLSHFKEITVRPSNAVANHFQAGNSDEFAIGARLEPDTLLSGNVFLQRDSFKISVQQFETATKKVLWGTTISGALADIFQAETEIVKQFQQTFSASQSVQSAPFNQGTLNANAYQEYLKGRFYYNSSRTADNVFKSVKHFENALRLDPEFAEAAAGLSAAYIISENYLFASVEQTRQAAVKNAYRALKLAPDLAEAQAVVAFVNYLYQWNWEESEKGFLRAIKLNPHLDLSHQWYGFFLRTMGRFEEAAAQYQLALKTNPASLPLRTALIGIKYESRRYEEAVDAALTELKISGGLTDMIYYILGNSYARLGEFNKAFRNLKKAYQITPKPIFLVAQAIAHCLAGEFIEARKTEQGICRLPANQKVRGYDFACLYANLGEHDKAYFYLDEAFKAREAVMIRIKVDCDLDPLRGQTRFNNLLKRMNLSDKI